MAKRKAQTTGKTKQRAARPAAVPTAEQRAAATEHLPQRQGQVAVGPGADVFARTVPFVYERHYFGENKKASMAHVEVKKEGEEREADKRLLTLTKKLIEMPEIAAIRMSDMRFYKYLVDASTPFRPGFYLVALGMVERVHARATSWESERAALADEAAEKYQAKVHEMRVPLGPLFNPADYPPTERFRAAFWVDWRFVDFGVPQVLRELRQEVFERERQKLEAAGNKARVLVEEHLAGALLKITAHLAELLTPRAGGKMPTLRSGALDRLFQFLNTAALRDVTDFKALQQVTGRLAHLASGLKVAQLRDDEDLRARMAAAMAEAKEQLAGLVSEETQRAILLRDDEVEVA